MKTWKTSTIYTIQGPHNKTDMIIVQGQTKLSTNTRRAICTNDIRVWRSVRLCACRPIGQSTLDLLSSGWMPCINQKSHPYEFEGGGSARLNDMRLLSSACVSQSGLAASFYKSLIGRLKYATRRQSNWRSY